MGEPSSSRGWLPARVTSRDDEPCVEWLDFGVRELSEPFFSMTANAVRRAAGFGRAPTTPATALLSVPEEVRPSGIIFHISRCGSTLLANLLRTVAGAIVVSEPQPVSSTVGSPALLAGAVRAYGRRRKGSERLLFLKLFSGNLFAIGTYRRLWPEVPFLIAIRDPVEVMVSCLAKDPGWMRKRAWPERAALRYGWPDGEARLPDEEFCARGVGAMLAAAQAASGPLCRVIDYTQITCDHVQPLAEFFGIDPALVDNAAIDAAFAAYAKDPQQLQPYVPDSQAKQTSATPAIRAAAAAWAETLYSRLRPEARW